MSDIVILERAVRELSDAKQSLEKRVGKDMVQNAVHCAAKDKTIASLREDNIQLGKKLAQTVPAKTVRADVLTALQTWFNGGWSRQKAMLAVVKGGLVIGVIKEVTRYSDAHAGTIKFEVSNHGLAPNHVEVQLVDIDYLTPVSAVADAINRS
jgi:hypothetical protein